MQSVINSVGVPFAKTALDDFFEQKVDFDIVLPDYCPPVMRIVKCDVTPAIMSKSLDGERLLIDVQCTANIVYIDDNGNIHSVSKNETFGKSLMPKAELSVARIRTVTRTVSVSCRLQNPRKISVKSVIGTAVKVIGSSECNIISEAHSGGIEASFDTVCANVLCGTGESFAHIGGQLSLKSPVTEIISSTATLSITDKKALADKILVKGEAQVSIVYMSGEGTDNLTFFEGTIPFSEVVDVIDATEDGSCDIQCDIQSIRCESVDDDGTVDCEIDAFIGASAYSSNNINILKDVYSMTDNLETTKSELTLESFCDRIEFNKTVSGDIACDFNEARIIGVCANSFVKNVGLREHNFEIEGDMLVTIYMCNSDDYAIIEKTVPFSLSHPAGNVCDNMRCEAAVDLRDLSCSMPNDDTIIIAADAYAVINCFSRQTHSVINSLEIADSRPKLCKGIVLYNAQCGEKLWDIAKKYRSSVDIIKRDNKLDDDIVDKNKMLLISFN